MTKTSAPAPKLASTILVIRDAPSLQVLMVKRHHQIDFAAGAMVFPGGKANDEDQSAEWRAYVRPEAIDEASRVARIAAIREAFEESGLLFARRKGGSELVDSAVTDPLQKYRSAVDKREQSFLELMRNEGLELALDRLIHFGHWITPDMMPKRFDTHFYLAVAPDDQGAEHDGRETTDSVWVSPSDALEMEARGEATIIFPTRMNLRKLAMASSTQEAKSLFVESGVVTVLPKVGKTEKGEPCLFIPEEAGYGQTQELLENIKA